MTKRKQVQPHNPDETAALKRRLAETEETLRAIQEYMVDAFVVNREQGIQVVTLNEAEVPYRTMVEAMNEGAITLIPDGTIFYCNPCFGEMVQKDPERLIGTAFSDLITPDGQSLFAAIFKQAREDPARGELCLKRPNGECVPVQVSIYRLGPEKSSGIAIIATDITERMQAEEKIRSLASKLTMVEQEERHRISQVLHEDLQQRLFALKAQLSFLSDFFEKDQVPAGFFAELDQIQSSLSEVVAITRNLSIDLNPVVLHGEGLADAMSWLAFRVKEQYGLHIDLEAKENFSELDYHVRMLLFQSIRELLFNVVKHAGVSEATVTLEQVNGRGRIIVSDAGKGFDAETMMKSPTRAHGLLIIQDRLSLLGCQMDLTSKVGKGTRVVIELPAERFSS